MRFYSNTPPTVIVNNILILGKIGKRRAPQSQNAALPRQQEEEETDKSKQAQINVRKALRLALSSPSEVIAMLKGLKNTRTK